MKRLFYIAILVTAVMASCTKDDAEIYGKAVAVSGTDTVAMEGITVKLYSESAELLKTTTTYSEGDYVLKDLEAGNYFIGATISFGTDSVYDTGNQPQLVYVSDEISKKVSLTLTKKN